MAGRLTRPARDRPLKLSVVIPAHNEVDSIGETVTRTDAELERAEIDYEIIVVDDASGDGTAEAVLAATADDPRVRCVRSHLPRDSATPSAPVSRSTPATRWRS